MSERWYQTGAIQSIFDYYDNGGTGNPVIALPTGSGKTHVITGFTKRVLNRWPNQRFLITTHVKELVKQNANKFADVWPHAPYGVYSAGLKSRDHNQPIIVGGIQSMHKAPELFGRRDLMIVDEGHLVSTEAGTMYQNFIAEMRKTNPYFKVIALSATIYRQKTGLITNDVPGRIFTDIIYDMTSRDNFNRLIAEGYLCPVIPMRKSIEIDVSGVNMSASGDFNMAQIQRDSDLERVTFEALKISCQMGYNRRSWLAFAAGIEHAERIAEILNSFGVPSVAVHSKLKADERDKRIEAHKRGEVRCLVGNNIFTTGYDHPPLDFIIDLQPTMSVPKHVQKYGRGTRIFPMKENCLILDFSGNTRRCGPINDPFIPPPPSQRKKGNGEAPVKECKSCGTLNHTTARVCDYCGEEFDFDTKIVQTASSDEIIVSDMPVIETFPVTNVWYSKRLSKKTGLPMLVVRYLCGVQHSFTEFISVENVKAKKFYYDWWRQRHADEPPETVDECLTMTEQLRVPERLKVWTNKRYPEITGYEW